MLALASAIAAHQAGRLAEAEKLYLSALRVQPTDANANYLLGALFYQRQELPRAREHLERALAGGKSHPDAQAMLGVVYSSLGETEKALTYLRAAASGSPRSSDAHYNLGRALLDLKRFDQAAESLQTALALQARPDALNCLAACRHGVERTQEAISLLRDCVKRFPEYALAHVSLGRMLIEQRNEDEAAQVLTTCLKLHPATADALLLLGNLRYRQARFADAEVFFRSLVALAPGNAVAINYLGAVLHHLARHDEAEVLVTKALNLRPNDPEILTNLGLILETKGDSAAAAGYHRRATDLNPRMAEAWNNLGMSLQHLGQWADAMACYDRATDLKPDFHGAKTNKAFALLSLGRFSEGWSIYRHRFDQKVNFSKRRVFEYPEWTGQGGGTATVLLWTDQGLGDEVLYASMVSEAAQKMKACVLECSSRMVPLFQRSFPGVVVVPRQTPPHPGIEAARPDHQLSLIELGEMLRPSVASIPHHNGYLKPDPALSRRLRDSYVAQARGRRIVGLSWKSENPNTGRFKSIPLTSMRGVLSTPDIFFVSLQYGEIDSDLESARQSAGCDIYKDPAVDPLHDPDASAAQIAAMDLVVTTSNTTAHFAGALAVPVWTLVPTGSGGLWYWFTERNESPWYPTMRLFRQSKPGDWASTIGAVADELRRWAAP